MGGGGRRSSVLKIIVGVEGNRKPVLRRARALHAPVMASANSLWDPRAGKFSPAWKELRGLEVHLDSGGFVAMKRYGGFRFSAEQYAGLAAEMKPRWWAQMDQCCEPEVAGDRSEVLRRIDRTAANLMECRALARDVGAEAPLMVLQGWKPEDYVSGPAFDDPAFEWPEVIGVGSVCRRDLHGPCGLIAVLKRIDETLPPHVRLHLFGVKGAAAVALRSHPRVESVDSMAWSARARVVAREAGKPCDNALRAEFMEKWLVRHREAVRPRCEEMSFCFEKVADGNKAASFSPS